MVMERLDAAKKLPENINPIKQFAIEQARQLLVSAKVKDPGTRVETIFREIKPPSQEFRPFTDREKEILEKDGAVIVALTGETIEQEQEQGRKFGLICDDGNSLLRVPSMATEVAIYPDPRRFFIANSNRKDLATQEQIAKKESRKLRRRLGLEDIEVIIPEQASTLTELIFRYFDQTAKNGKGVWLFGSEYGEILIGSEYGDQAGGRTKNPVNESGSLVAKVGRRSSSYDNSVYIHDSRADEGHSFYCVVRLIVAKKK